MLWPKYISTKFGDQEIKQPNSRGEPRIGQNQTSKTNLKNNDISNIDTPPGVPGVSKNPKDQSKDHFGKLER